MKSMRRKLSRRILPVVLLMISILAATFGSQQVYAEENQYSLTLTGAEAGMVFRLYQVESGQVSDLTPTDAFAGSSVNWKVESSEEMYELSVTLQSYVQSNKVAADAVQKADADGKVSFTGLPAGVYMALGDATKNNEASPVMVYLPYLEEDNTLVTDATAVVKLVQKPQYTHVSVCKIWKNDTEKDRPESITVELTNKDGRVGDPVKLNAENNWQYTWVDLPAGVTYTVVEKGVPANYTWSLKKDGNACTITNTKDVPGRPPKEDKPKGHLPQTGQYWWPVVVLTNIGVLLIMIGIYLRWSERNRNR